MTRHRAIFLALYAIGAAFLIGPETVAIFNDAGGDTITENVRDVIFFAPVVWYISLFGFAGFTLWLVRHFWWRKQ